MDALIVVYSLRRALLRCKRFGDRLFWLFDGDYLVHAGCTVFLWRFEFEASFFLAAIASLQFLSKYYIVTPRIIGIRRRLHLVVEHLEGVFDAARNAQLVEVLNVNMLINKSHDLVVEQLSADGEGVHVRGGQVFGSCWSWRVDNLTHFL